MPASPASQKSHSVSAIIIGAALAVGVPLSAAANVITDWDDKAVAVIAPMASLGKTPPEMERLMAIVHAAMFDAVNSIEPRYRPYLTQLPADSATSKEAAAAAAAAAVLATIDGKTAGDMQTALAAYLGSIPEGAAKSDGIKLGEAIAAKVIEARAQDGCDAPDAYRPRTSPGVYVPTAMTVSSMWPDLTPFAIAKPSQFRPKPPVALDSEDWARDYNEIKDYGRRSSAKRTEQQTETARFWLTVGPAAYHPFTRQLVIAKQMDVVDSARFMALVSFAINDALVAVMDAKYHYNFWRPITAIRNGDIDGNPATEVEATWQPIAVTPMHPEYPCAHCISSGAVAGVIKTALGSELIPEIEMKSPTAPGVTHRFTDMTAYMEEVANARIWAGFHYRFSTRVGTDMGLQIGEYVAKNVMQPVQTSGR
ncbi:vanadium-dependent haloperoxidase [Bradyrhizobium sp. STM 3557]|uniref:vanadium-dependent haloperoxidase n=1 Tax=Bradyrhizobium sp. STM 3557 TaxID=578920 RepID=UPI00388D1298